MLTRLRWACVAFAATLLAASACFAQQPDSAVAGGFRSGYRPGRGAIGGQIGGSSFLSEGDYSAGAQARLAFAGQFRYVSTPSLRWQVTPYFAWAHYKNDEPMPFQDPQFPTDATKDRVLTLVAGANAQIQWVFGGDPWRWHVGAGPAVYRVVVENRRKVLRDPATNRLHQGAYLGAAAEIGVERFLKALPNTSLEATLGAHSAFAKRSDQFPSGFDGQPVIVDLRLGGHYYYDFRRSKKTDTPRALSRP